MLKDRDTSKARDLFSPTGPQVGMIPHCQVVNKLGQFNPPVPASLESREILLKGVRNVGKQGDGLLFREQHRRSMQRNGLHGVGIEGMPKAVPPSTHGCRDELPCLKRIHLTLQLQLEPLERELANFTHSGHSGQMMHFIHDIHAL